MWVFDLETLAFLEVNKSAIQHYGYSPRRISGDENVGPAPD